MYRSFFKSAVTTTLSLALFAGCMNGQNNSHFTSSRSADGVWTIVENAGNSNVNIYVVEGKDSALVIDAGMGSDDLKSYIMRLTNLPLVVVNTHGHGDHTGSDRQFSKVYLHPADFHMVKALNNIVPVKEGHVFDLGGRSLEVIETPGHTHGSIVLLDAKNHILFAGDHINALVWLFLKDCYPLEVYLKSLQKVEKMADQYNVIMPGHNTPLPAGFIGEQISCINGILDGSCVGEHYENPVMRKGALICKYKTAQITYDPENLFEKR